MESAQSEQFRDCPSCGKEIKVQAKLCKHCHATVSPQINTETSSPNLEYGHPVIQGSPATANNNSSSVQADSTGISPVNETAHKRSNLLPIGAALACGFLIGAGCWFGYTKSVANKNEAASHSSQESSSSSEKGYDNSDDSSANAQKTHVPTSPSDETHDETTASSDTTTTTTQDATASVPPAPDTTQTSTVANPTDQTQEDTSRTSESTEAADNKVTAEIDEASKQNPDIQGNQEEAGKLNKIGLSALKAKDYTLAVQEFEQASAADPKDPKLLSNQGYAEMHAGMLVQAKHHMLQSLALDRTREVAWNDLGMIYAKTKQQDLALSAFTSGYKCSQGKSIDFMKTLEKDEDPELVEIGALAVKRLEGTDPTVGSQ